MSDLIIQMPSYGKMLYNFTRCGELYVIGSTIIESEEQEAKLNRNVARNAFIYLLRRHPMLRANLEIDGSSVSYRINNNLENIIIDEHEIKWVELNSRDELNPKLEELNRERFDYEAKCKLWRCSVYSFKEDIQKYAIGLLIPLFITDALNITTLMIELTNIINSIIINVECEEMKTRLDVIDDVHTIMEKSGLLTEERLSKIKEINAEPKAKFKLPELFRDQNEKGSKIDTFVIDKESTKQIIETAKLKNTKLTGFFIAAIFYSLKDLYDEHGLEFPKDVIYGVSANLRFRLDPKVDFSNIGYFSALISLNACYPDFGLYKSIWDDSCFLDRQITERANLSTGAILHDIYNLEATNYLNEVFEENGNDMKKVCSMLNKDSTWDIILSNSGKYVYNEKKQNPEKPFKINEIYFADSLNSDPPIDACLVFHITYWDGQFMFMISANKSGISSRYVDRYNEILKRNIKNYSKIL